MPFWERGLKSVREQAEKGSFEVDKIMRAKREEGAANDLASKRQARVAELGQITLDLVRRGAIGDPAITAVAKEIASFDAQIKQVHDKIEAIKAEQWQPPAVEPAPAPAASPAKTPPPVAPAENAGAAAEVSPPAVAKVTQCPNCQTAVAATVAFCPECGTRLK